MPQHAPNIDGVMILTDDVKATIKAKLDTIIASFVATDAQPVCDTFYITSTYNKENTSACINGDTCEAILAPAPPQGV